MLVLSRRENERIRIGKDVVVTIVRIRGSVVRVGIDAPPNVNIVREELERYDDTRQEPPTPLCG